MRAVWIATALAAVSAAASAGLPLRSGTYVLAGTPCRDAPFAAMMSYDGKGLGDPHDAQCRSRVLGKTGRAYRVATTCTANGDGSPTKPSTMIATLRFPSVTSFVYASAGSAQPGATYRWCPAGH